MAKAIAILGTASDVGKSVVAAALGRLVKRTGVHVAPFKAQNMSLNSFVTSDGGEMGRAQVLQAYACGVEPHVDMNPILLKPEAENRSQVIVLGKVRGRQEAQDYFRSQHELLNIVRESYRRLAARYDVVIIEGAGSAAEMNLRDRDVVNWPVVELADAGVILVADIDRGGVFAQVIGTLDLLTAQERRRVIGVIINKFRGDRSVFEDGVGFLEHRTGVPILGVLPYLRQLELDQEDSVTFLSQDSRPFSSNCINIGVVLLPHMSNFTDFNSLLGEEDVALRYVKRPNELEDADVVIVPGTKNTIGDLRYLFAEGFCSPLTSHVHTKQREVVGVCGGYQMLGTRIADPHGAEEGGEISGLGLLSHTTELLTCKRTSQVMAHPLFLPGAERYEVVGYEIHMGVTQKRGGAACFHIVKRGASLADKSSLDGSRSHNALVWGTYIHGVFDRPGFRRMWLNRVRARKGLPPLDMTVSERASQRLSQAIDRWADHVERHINLQPFFAQIGL